MKLKSLNYFKNIPLINLVAYVFDPICKLDGLNDYLSVYYGCWNIIDDNKIDINLIINQVRRILIELFEQFRQYVQIPTSTSSSFSISSSQIQVEPSKISINDRVLIQR